MPSNTDQSKKSFILYVSYEEQLDMLDDAQLRTVVKAIFAVARGEEVPQLGDPMANMALSFIASQMRRDMEAWEQAREAKRKSGSSGGLAKARNARTAKEELAKLAVLENPSKASSATFASESVAGVANLPVNVDVNADANGDETPPMPPEGASGARRSSPIRTGMPSKAHPAYRGFCAVWQVYPLQQGEDDAWRTYARLYDDGVLPESYALRDSVIEMAENDVRWKDGKMPLMANWLDGHRWKDKPLRAAEEPRRAGAKPLPFRMLPVPNGPDARRPAAKVRDMEEKADGIIDLE